MTGCTCTGPGNCKRHGVEKTPHLYHLCQTKDRYFQAWEEGRGPLQASSSKNKSSRPKKKPKSGPGTELSLLLKRAGITYKPGCSCQSHAATMDRRGVEWCQKNTDAVLKWMQQEAKKRGLPFSRTGAKLLLSLAIRRAKKKQGLDKTAKV